MQPLGIAAAVHAFVHLVHGFEDGQLEVDLAQDVGSVVHMFLDHELLLFRELVDLGQHGLVDEDLADLGQVGGDLHRGLVLGGQLQAVGQQGRDVAHEDGVPGQVRVRELDGLDQGFNRLGDGLALALLCLDHVRDVAEHGHDALGRAGVVPERDLGDLEVVLLGLEEDALREGHGLSGLQRLVVGLLQALARVEAEQGDVVEAQDLLLGAADTLGQGRVGVGVVAAQVLDGDEVRDGVVDGIQEVALLFEFMGQGPELAGDALVVLAQGAPPDGAEEQAQDQGDEPGDEHRDPRVVLQGPGGVLDVHLLDDPQVKLRKLHAQGEDGRLAAQGVALGEAEPLPRVQFR